MIAADAAQWFAHTALTGALLVAVPVALLAGIVSFFSPCVLPLVPAYVSWVTGLSGADLETVRGRGARSRRSGRVLLGAVLFVLGFTVVFVAFGAVAGTLGVFIRGHLDVLYRVSGVLLIALGLVFAGVLPWLQRDVRAVHRVRGAGLVAAPLIGALFGLGWTPCIGPTMSAVLTLALDAGRASRGGLLMAVYGIGLGVPFVLAAVGYRRALQASAWVRAHPRVVSSVGGGLLVLLGLAMVTGVWESLVTATQSWVGRFGETAV